MELYTVDAFTDVPFGGNPAGVAIYDEALPTENEMRAVAAKVGYSETAFILPLDDESFRIRYFTPVEEVALCGHATVGSFSLMLKKGMIKEGRSYVAHTGAGDINVDINNGLVWLDMAQPNETMELPDDDAALLLEMYSLARDACGDLRPAIVNAGLPDIMLPLRNRALLARMEPDFAAISELSKKYEVTGVHACAFGEGATGYCRNFAPLYGIDEESATGTSNGALTWYLYRRGLVEPGKQNLFVQGEAMGKPSKIYSVLTFNAENAPVIRIGGSALVRK